MKHNYEIVKQKLSELVDHLPDKVFNDYTAHNYKIHFKEIRQCKDKYRLLIQKQTEQIQETGDKILIGLIGNVNAGKSSLGNLLLEREPSEIFAENIMRETVNGKIIPWNDELLIDLPGLGFDEKDDEVVRNYIQRSNILILVMDIKSSIDDNLYHFIRKEIAENGNSEQELIIILNKIEFYTNLGFSGDEIEEEINKIKQYLLFGEGKEFKGIQELFEREINIIPLSVYQGRKDRSVLVPLLDEINRRKGSIKPDFETNYVNELLTFFDDLSVFEMSYDAFENTYTKQSEDIKEMESTSRVEMGPDFVLGINNQVKSQIGSFVDNHYYALNNLPKPNFFQKNVKLFFGDGYTNKLSLFKDEHDSYVKSIRKNYKTITNNVNSDINERIKNVWKAESIQEDMIGNVYLDPFIRRLEKTYDYFVGKFFESKDLQYNSFSYDRSLNEEVKQAGNILHNRIDARIKREKDLAVEKRDPLIKLFHSTEVVYRKYNDFKILIHGGPSVQEEPVQKGDGTTKVFLIIVLIIIIVSLIVLAK